MDDNKEIVLKILRDSLKEHRDILEKSGDDELTTMAKVFDTFILVSYNPEHLIKLTSMLTKFLEDQMGGKN